MSLRRNTRSSSASGRLETKSGFSLPFGLSDGLEKKINLSRPGDLDEKTDDFTAAQHVHFSDGEREQTMWMLKHHRRRHSVTLGDKILVCKQQHSCFRSANKLEPFDFKNCLIDEKISLESLQKLKLTFEEYEAKGLRCIDEGAFGHALKTCFGLSNTSNEQIHGLFKKIDYLDQGKISWADFCTHILHEYHEKEEIVKRSKQVAFAQPAKVKTLSHDFPIVNIHSTHDGSVFTVREDGLVCHWSAELKLQKSKQIFNEGSAGRKSRWATDSTLMEEYKKLIIGTGSKEIQFYELSTLKPCCQISALASIPLTVDCSSTGPDKCCVLYGDTEGCVNIFFISAVKQTFRSWNILPKIENIPTTTVSSAVLSPDVTFVRWKVHCDWVTKVKYFHSFEVVASSSNEESSSLVLGRLWPLTDSAKRLQEIREAPGLGRSRKVKTSAPPQARAPCDQTVFTICKGVKDFDLCLKHKLLVTGGMDRLIRLWHPHFSGKPTGVLKGHSTPIIFLRISSKDSQIVSVSVDCIVKIWHIRDECCLFTGDSKASCIYREISACHYSPAMKSLYIAADSMAVLKLKLRPEPHRRLTESHNEPVLCCCYSEEFRQVVSCGEGSMLKVWDLDTGCQLFEFGSSEDVTITCMTMDNKGRRLFTGRRDGSLKIWNFNSGQCLKTLKKDGKCRAVCDCTLIKVHTNFYVVSVGRDHRIDIYSDVPMDSQHVQKPHPPWQEDLINGHKEDVLCVAQCPPSLLATSSCAGEIIVWNAVSGSILCRFVGPVAHEQHDAENEELDISVPSMLFFNNQKFERLSSHPTLLSSGIRGYVNQWNVLGGGKLVSSFKASKFQQKIIKLAKSEQNMLLYAADRIGYVFVFSMSKFDLDQNPPRAEMLWRAHTSRITSPAAVNKQCRGVCVWESPPQTSLQVVDSDQVVLTSSTDHTVRLWSAYGEYIGTFGQPEIWNIHVSSSWMHPAVPYEVLIDPLSMPNHGTLNGKPRQPEPIILDKTEPDRGELKSLG
ncbi:hypothetical protein OJAV_G00132040 [Oryzias javanicus]|uniref:Uncharacterized protein n=1 Tax=Oryzias javanicus TaxID=123683 RepID=A0A3S2PZ11_ORYJA|nr:hypothetical protein OJAV_G00132040 [Oryzias javanicus]